MNKMKKRLSSAEEFEVMKLVLDKFLWLGFIIMGLGLYLMIRPDPSAVAQGLTFIIAGTVILVLFMILIIREYEFVK